MSRALEEVLDQLHAELAKTLLEGLKASPGEEKTPPSPQFLSQVIKFLKDNGVDTPAKAQRVTDLVDQLASMPLDLDDLALGQRPN